MRNWQRWAWVLAWMGWLLGSWSSAQDTSAQVSPHYVLPGGTVKWKIPDRTIPGVTLPDTTILGGPFPDRTIPGETFPDRTVPGATFTPGKSYQVKIGAIKVDTEKVTESEPHTLTFEVPQTTFEGVVPLWVVDDKDKTAEAEMIVTGLDAQVGHDPEGKESGVVAVNWIECNPVTKAESIMRQLQEAAATLVRDSRDIKVIQPKTVGLSPLKGKGGVCQCQVVEATFNVILTTDDAAKRANAFGKVVEALRGWAASGKNKNLTLPEPLIVRSALTHGLYHAGPDHVQLAPLNIAGNGPIKPFDTTQLSLPTAGKNRVLVAILDTGLAPAAFRPPARQPLALKNFIPGATDSGDPFDVQKAFPSNPPQFPGFPLHQGSGHGTPAAWLIAQEAGAAVDILPVRVCDSEGLCRDPQIMQGLCYAAQYYRDHQKTYPGGLVINLSLGSFTPSKSLHAVLDSVTSQTISGENRKRGARPWVVAAAGNYIPNKMKRDKLSRTNPDPAYLPGTAEDWEAFTARFPYARVYPAGFGIGSPAAGVQTPVFAANDHIVGVGSLEHLKNPEAWKLTDTSMRGNFVRVCAPGRYVRSVGVNGQGAMYSGTSYAAPVFTGLLATMLTKTPTMNWATISSQLPIPIRTSCF